MPNLVYSFSKKFATKRNKVRLIHAISAAVIQRNSKYSLSVLLEQLLKCVDMIEAC